MYTRVEAEWAFTPEAVVVLCRDRYEARFRVQSEYQYWAELAATMGVPIAKLQYSHRGRTKSFPVLAANSSETPMMTTVNERLARQVFTSPKLAINIELQQVMARLIESDKPMFLLANDSDDQLWLNELACQMIQSSGSEAVRRCMRDYWESASLDGLHQKLRDTAAPFEHRYRAILNDENLDVWFEAVSLYEPVNIGGRSFRLSTNQHFEIIGRAQLATFR